MCIRDSINFAFFKFKIAFLEGLIFVKFISVANNSLQYLVKLKKIYPLVSKYFFKLIKRLLSPFFSNKRLLASNNVGRSKPKSLIPGLFILPANIICFILF